MRRTFSVGDLVEITMIGSPFYECKGIVLDKVYYTEGHTNATVHPDEYSCKINILNGKLGTGKVHTVRAKWLKLLSRKKKEWAL